jgi:hypothetical protein
VDVADFTSSSSWRIMLPMRMTLAGCSTRSVKFRPESASDSESARGSRSAWSTA